MLVAGICLHALMRPMPPCPQEEEQRLLEAKAAAEMAMVGETQAWSRRAGHAQRQAVRQDSLRCMCKQLLFILQEHPQW